MFCEVLTSLTHTDLYFILFYVKLRLFVSDVLIL